MAGLGAVVVLVVFLLMVSAPVLAIIFGITALVKIKGSRGRLKGSGMAWTGIVVGAVMLFVAPVFAAILFLLPARMSVAERAEREATRRVEPRPIPAEAMEAAGDEQGF